MFTYSKNQIARNTDFRKSSIYSVFKNQPFGFVDIGARGGVHDLVVPLAEITSVVGFEPDREECERLMKIEEVHAPWAAFKLEPIGLYNEAGKQTLHHMRADTNHSLLPSNQNFVSRYNMKQFEKVGESTVATQTLDFLYEHTYRNAENFGEFLKVDTQGSEFEILQGSRNVLENNTVAIVCEVSFFEIYKGQKLFSEVEQLLRSLGFSFYGFDSSIHTRSKKYLDKRTQATRERAMYADAVFFKDPINNTIINNTKRQNQSLFLSTLLLGYFDFAIELCENCLELEPVEIERSKKLIESLSQLLPQESLRDIENAFEQARNTPNNANVIVGSFVDQRRSYCDYDDVANVSQFIKNLH